MVARLDDRCVVGCPLDDHQIVLDGDTAGIDIQAGQEPTDGQWLSEFVGIAVQRDAHGVVQAPAEMTGWERIVRAQTKSRVSSWQFRS